MQKDEFGVFALWCVIGVMCFVAAVAEVVGLVVSFVLQIVWGVVAILPAAVFLGVAMPAVGTDLRDWGSLSFRQRTAREWFMIWPLLGGIKLTTTTSSLTQKAIVRLNGGSDTPNVRS